ncbi:MAG: ABC transporter permease [Gemmatimonadales bacterium]
MDTLIQDLRHTWRSLTRAPGFTAVVVLVLALGIGGSAIIFGVVNAVLLRPLPYPDADRLVRAFAVFKLHGNGLGVASPSDFTDWRSRSHSFIELAASNSGTFALTGDGPAEQVPGVQVTGGFFNVTGVSPVLGRTITTLDDSIGGPNVAVLGAGLWQRRFGGDPRIVGRTIRLDGNAYQVIGVMPQGYDYPDASQIWLPQRFSAQDLATQRGAHYIDVTGRLRPGVTVAAADLDLRAISAQLATEYPRSNANQGATVTSLRDALVGNVRQPLLIVLAAVALVLLIACTNVAGLLVVRGLSREREIAVRAALGAGRGRLIQGLLTDSLVLALLGGAAGILLAAWGTALISRYAGSGIPFLPQVRVDGTVLAFAAAAALLTALLCGLLPAWQASSVAGLGARLKSEGRTSTGGRGRTRNALVVVQTALAMMLLVGAGLLYRSFEKLSHVDPGFSPDHVLTFGVSLPDAGYAKPGRSAAFADALTARLAALPGVQTVGAVFGLPLSGFSYGITPSTRDGQTLSDQEQEQLVVQVRIVTPDYFKTMGIAIRRGRGVTVTDRIGAPPVLIVNEAAAKLLWPGLDPLGHQLTIGTRFADPNVPPGGTVVGVIGDIRDRTLAKPGVPTIYLPHAQNPVGSLGFAIRTADDPLLLTKAVGRALQETDPEVPLFRLRTMDQAVANNVAQPRLYAALLIAFALVAITLAGIGLYGVLAQTVVQRTRELGVRVALGATARDVLGLVLGQGMRLAAFGVLLGLVGGLLASRALGSLLYDVAPADPMTFFVVAAGLLVVAVLASFIPARRAAVVHPMEALRYE